MSWINKLMPWTTPQSVFEADIAAQKSKNSHRAIKAESLSSLVDSLPPLEVGYRAAVALDQAPKTSTPAPETPKTSVLPPVQSTPAATPEPSKGKAVAVVLLIGAALVGSFIYGSNSNKPVVPPTPIVSEPNIVSKPNMSTIPSGTLNLSCQVVDGQLPPVVVTPPVVVPPVVVPPPVQPPVVPPVQPPVVQPPVVTPPVVQPPEVAEIEPGTVLYGFKGLGGIFDVAAFKQFAIERGMIPIIINSWDSKAAVNEMVAYQKDFKTPYALYGFSIGGQTVIKAVQTADALVKNGKPGAPPVAVFTIGSSSVISFKGVFDNIKIVEFYFHANTAHDVAGKYVKAPHTGKGNIQQVVADMFKKG